MRSNTSTSVGLLLAGLCLSAAPASAKDLSRLVQLLTPVYLAQNLTSVCAARNPAFLARTGGPFGTTHAYAQHVKEEVIASLPSSEADLVMRTAADAAKAAALQQVRALKSPSPEIEAERTDQWCRISAEGFVREIVRSHDVEHEGFVQGVEHAKKQ
jgi:hypothetical protein